MSKITVSIVSLLVAAAIVGAYFFPGGNTIVNQVLQGTGAAGNTYNTAKYAGIVMIPSSGTATTSSITNNDATDRYITAVRVGCQNVATSKTAYTGTGLANLLLTIGTSSASAPAIFNPWGDVALLTIATSTQNFVLASSTLQTNLATSSANLVWPAGVALTFGFNATNTAACTVGVDYIGS